MMATFLFISSIFTRNIIIIYTKQFRLETISLFLYQLLDNLADVAYFRVINYYEKWNNLFEAIN